MASNILQPNSDSTDPTQFEEARLSCQSPEYTAVSKTDPNIFASLLEEIRLVSLRLATECDSKLPGTTFGMWRHNHMQEGRLEVPKVASDFKIHDNDIPLLEVLFSSHDLGRPIEALRRLEKLSVENHGVYSCEVLKSLTFFNKLHIDDQKLIEDALRWHGERIVNLPEGNSRTMCYVLRDLDKLEAFRQTLDYKPSFVLNELISYFGFSDSEIEVLWSEKDKYIEVIKNCLDKGGGSFQTSLDDPIAKKIVSIMNKPLTREEGAVGSVLAHTCVDYRDPSFEWKYASFFLLQAAFVFDLDHSSSLTQVRDEDLLRYRLEFIEERCDPILFAEIENALFTRL